MRRSELVSGVTSLMACFHCASYDQIVMLVAWSCMYLGRKARASTCTAR
jgi:hypothetical protein